MLDVHAPHEKIHGLKDFLLHLLTITVGLLIALGLEGCVERVHQHHLRDEADANLKQEIRHNEHEVELTRAAIVAEQKNLRRVMQFLQARSENKKYDLSQIEIGYTSGTLSDASWRTATATGSLSFMEYDRVQQFAAAYQVQELFARLDEQTLHQFLELQAYVAYNFDPDKISPADAKAAAVDVRKTLSNLSALNEIGESLRQTYEKALNPK